MNLFEKLSAIQNELSAVAKNLMVGEGKSSYKAVGEADVLAAVKPLEYKYRVYSYPYSRKIIDNDLITTAKTYEDQRGNKTVTETSRFYMRVETIYRFVDIDDPDYYIDIKTYGDGIDSQDKAPGKAMTYGDKYALLKAYKIITGEDPDQNVSEEGKVSRSAKASYPQKSGGYAPASQPVAQTPEVITKDQRAVMIARAREVYGDKAVGNQELVNIIRAEGFNDAYSITVPAYNRIMQVLDNKEKEMADAVRKVAEDIDKKMGENPDMGLPFK